MFYMNKKLLLVTSWEFPHVGGVSSHISLLADKLEISHSEVINFRHITNENASSLLKKLIIKASRAIRKTFNFQTITTYSDALQKVIQKEDFEIIHCHDAMAAWAAIKARQKFKRNYKIVVTVHGPTSRHMIEEGQHPNTPDVLKVEQCEKEAWHGCDAIITVDKTQAEIVMEQGGVANKITIIPNAVDIQKLKKIAQALPVMRKTDREWLFVPRRLTPKNGIEYAIRAMPLLKKKPLLLLAGSGMDKEKLEQLVKLLNLQNDVLFLGALNHEVMLPLMSASDIVLVPSVPIHGIVEATSIAAIEAMALGKPVVASGIGGLNELIVNNMSGLLIPPGDPQKLAAAIELLLDNKELRSHIQEVAQQTVREQFSDDIWIKRHLDIYKTLLN
jgi:glycosyltransferase involved in cell wall biosynthesis